MTRRFALTASAFALGLAISLQPLSLDMASLKFEKSQAQAKGGGNGGGNGGHGGGNGGDHGGHGGNSGGGSHNSGSESSHGGGHDRSERTSGSASVSTSGQSRAEQARNSTRDAKIVEAKVPSEVKQAASSAKSIGLDTAKLGRMNAVHASATARQHAAANSTVGLIAAYEKALSVSEGTEDQITDADISEAAKALAALSKEGVPEEPVALLNEKLGLEIDSDVLSRVIEEAREFQTSEQ